MFVLLSTKIRGNTILFSVCTKILKWHKFLSQVALFVSPSSYFCFSELSDMFELQDKDQSISLSEVYSLRNFVSPSPLLGYQTCYSLLLSCFQRVTTTLDLKCAGRLDKMYPISMLNFENREV